MRLVENLKVLYDKLRAVLALRSFLLLRKVMDNRPISYFPPSSIVVTKDMLESAFRTLAEDCPD